jgi:hypothetical protein
MLWFLRLFPIFRNLEALVQIQAKKAEEFDAVSASLSEARVELESANTDLENLREAHQDLVTEKLLLQDRLESAMADKDNLWSLFNESLGHERYALQTMVNHAVQKTGAGIPFPEAHSLPSSAVKPLQPGGSVGRAARMLPSEAVGRANQAFIRNYYAEPVTTEA